MAVFTTRPVIMGTRGVVTSGHYLVSSAGLRILMHGGNAIDAAAAMGFCEALLEPQSNGIGGEVPTLIYSAKESKTYSISGMGWSPKSLTIEWCRDNGIDLIPGDGYIPACVPAVVGTWATALARFGTKSFSEILQPAIEMAEDGFPVYERLHARLSSDVTKFTQVYPTTGEVYYPDGKVPELGEILRNPDFAEMLKTLCRAEKNSQGKSRVAGIEAARDAFYKGEIAEDMVRFCQEEGGMLTMEDLSEFQAKLEPQAIGSYKETDIYTCGTWCQGPVSIQALQILEGLDLQGMGHNSPEYLHAVLEALKLAFADRHSYYGDPDFVDVPLEGLLSKAYAAERRNAIDAQQARP